jgi:putative ABC transport system substrate-binding protein
MRRREFITLVGGAAVAWPQSLYAQQLVKLPRVGVLTAAESDATAVFAAFRMGLRDLGYVDGRTIILDFRFAKGNMNALAGLADELARLPADVIVADGNGAARAALNATHTIPIVMGIAADAIETGLSASTARPTGNLTGMTLGSTQLSGKRLELVKQAIPGMTQVTVLLNPKALSAPFSLRATEDAAKALDLRIAKLWASSPDELRALTPASLAAAEGVVVMPDSVFWNYRQTITALMEAAHVPAIYPERDYADDGALIAYGPNVPDSFRRAASYVDRILRGAKPGDLPIDEASKFDFVINLKTAKALGLTIPPLLLASADEVIE